MVSVISSTWMLVGGPGGPDRWHSQTGKRSERDRDRETDRGKEEKEGGWRKCKSVRDGTMAEGVAVILAPAAAVAKSVHCETFGSYVL